jgi:sigma-B regulation protein RsbU (phosphoserine phosphatase)
MIAAARSLMARPAQVILDHVFDAADKFTGGARQHDDMTLLVLKLN